MKGIPIKFRGKRVKDDKTVYGWAYKSDCPMSSFPAIIDYNDKFNAVYPDSVCQFLGYDVDGKEVYEGDPVKALDGDYYVAFLEARVIWSLTFGATWSIPFEQPHSKAARQADLKSMSLEFWNKIEQVRLKDKKEKWLKAVEENEQ